MDVLRSLGIGSLGAPSAFDEKAYQAEKWQHDRDMANVFNNMAYRDEGPDLIRYFSDLGLTRQEIQKALFQAYKEKVNG